LCQQIPTILKQVKNILAASEKNFMWRRMSITLLYKYNKLPYSNNSNPTRREIYSASQNQRNIRE
jgi:hypothetical protein